jgi:hypothetical protein
MVVTMEVPSPNYNQTPKEELLLETIIIVLSTLNPLTRQTKSGAHHWLREMRPLNLCAFPQTLSPSQS